MSDEHYALSPAHLQPPPPTEADYDAIFAAVMETVRGRWFLSEFGRRNRQADTQIVLGAIERLEAMVRGERTDPAFERIRSDIRDMADAIAATRREIAAIRHDDDHKGIGDATEELDAIVMATERATSDILAAAETIQETAWTLREQGLDGESCDKLDRCATDVYLACSFQDLTGQRTRKVIHVLRYLEDRINAMVEILGDDGRPEDEPARAHAPLDIDMDQAEIDEVIPTTHAERAAPFAESMTVAPAAEAWLDPAPTATADLQTAEQPSSPAPWANAEAMFDAGPEALSVVSPEPMETVAGETGLDELALVRPSLTPMDASLADDADIFADVAVADGQAETAADAQPEAAIEPSTAGHDDALATVDFVADMDARPEFSRDGDADRLDDGFAPEHEASGGDDVFLADSSPIAALADSEAAPDAEAPDESATTEEFTDGARAAGAETKALMADLLAIIRPNGTSDAADNADRDPVAIPDEAATARLAEPAPPREDLRLLRPMAPAGLSSDFIIVSFATDADAAEAGPSASGETVATDEASEPVAKTLAEPATDLNAPPVEPDSTAVAIETMADEPRPAAAADEAFAAAVEELTSEPAVATDIAMSELDNDLLLAAEALGPRPAPVVDEPASAQTETSDHTGIESEWPTSTDDVSPDAAPDGDALAATPTEPGDADVTAPASPDPAIAPDASGTDDATTTDAAATWPEVREELAVALSAGEDRASDEPAPHPVAFQPQIGLTAHATAALAVLAMSATTSMMAETGTDSAREEAVGHADPLAAVNALSVEERIALFS